jgi:AcrR family transcriptional regulator
MPNPYTPRHAPNSGAGGRPPLISRESILKAARSLPADKLTMPLVAAQLGVNAAALYYHFESRAALLAELSSLIVTDFKVGPVDPKRWRLWLERTALDLCRFLIAHPVVFEVENWADTIRISVPALESLLQGMEEAGFAPAESLQIWTVMGAYVYTRAQAQYHASHMDTKTRQQLTEKYSTYLQQCPHFSAAAGTVTVHDPEQAFLKSVRWLIALLPAPGSGRTAKVRRRKV